MADLADLKSYRHIAELSKRVANLERGQSIDDPAGNSHDHDMVARLSRLEGTQDGVKQSQSILIGSVMGLAALFFALAGIMVTLQLDTKADVRDTSSRIEELSNTLRSEFASMRAEQTAQTSAIANAITAARQQPTQVILVPQSDLQSQPPVQRP